MSDFDVEEFRRELRGELAPYDRAELEALRDLHDGSKNRRERSLRMTAAAASFGVSLACVAVAVGGGPLGVLFVVGLVTGFRLITAD